jgi:hypothetical protein
LSIALLRIAAGAHLSWSKPISQRFEDRNAMAVGILGMAGSAAVFLFLLSAALFLPE